MTDNMFVDKFRVDVFLDTNSFSITRHYEVVSKAIDNMGIDDLYALEFIIKEIKRKFDL